jgi:HD-GYP domain-containing protein (c-di-GMP phosphodiesterase class II)
MPTWGPQGGPPGGIDMSEVDTNTRRGIGSPASSARSGFIPIPLTEVSAAALEGMSVFLKADHATSADGQSGGFTLYRNVGTRFTEDDRRRLLGSRVNFVYVRTADHRRFRENLVGQLERVVSDAGMPTAARAAVVYQTSLELINELLADPDLPKFSAQLGSVTRAVSTFVLNDATAFSHLFATAQHDFYTATHMVNVATWMVALAHAMGYDDAKELTRICEAGLLHDLGKIHVPDFILNKREALSETDWEAIKQHPEKGAGHLAQYDEIDPLIITVTRQHHERMDGSGYPQGLTGENIHPVSRICAVVDSFDAMTAVRPFKKEALSVGQALAVLNRKTPQEYDSDVVATWRRLVGSVESTPAVGEVGMPSDAGAPKRDRRKHPRFTFNCPARVEVIGCQADDATKGEHTPVLARNISRSGLGVLSQVPIPAGAYVRVYLRAHLWSREFLTAEVVRCHDCQDGWYDIGLRFTRLD